MMPESPPTSPIKPRSRTLPAAIILGGDANALSVARSLSRLGVRVVFVGPDDCYVRHSRHCRAITFPASQDPEQAIAAWLLGPDSRDLDGAVLLACSDAAIQVLIRHGHQLKQRYLLEECDPAARLAMLDKQTTYQHAQAAGVPTPRWWIAHSRDQVLALADQLAFPLIVKPRLSHLFESVFGQKYLFASDLAELLAGFDAAGAAGIDVMLVEWIPGPDDRLCSYYTYLDEHHAPLFHFTKRIIRRYPAGMGSACYHITDWIPDLIEPATALFKQARLQGLANVEFKRDQRDGQFKLIECNARFTASNCLVASSGFDLAAFVYNRATGRPNPPLKDYRQGLRLWDPLRDIRAFVALRKNRQITTTRWLAGLLHRQKFPFFAWSDPMPAMFRVTKPVRKLLRRPRPELSAPEPATPSL